MHRVALNSNGCPALSLARHQGQVVLAVSVCITPALLHTIRPKALGLKHCICSLFCRGRGSAGTAGSAPQVSAGGSAAAVASVTRLEKQLPAWPSVLRVASPHCQAGFRAQWSQDGSAARKAVAFLGRQPQDCHAS